MALNVGDLYATIEVKADGVDRELSKVKTGLTEVKDAADKVSNLDVKVGVKNTDDITKATRSTDELGKAAKRSATESEKIQFPKDYATDADRARQSVESFEGGIAKAAASFTKFTAVAAGGAVVAGIGTSLVKGFSRLDAIDQATAKLEALGNTSSDVRVIMDNALASVKGTSFGLGEAAGTAATMVASGIQPGKQLESVLKGVADTAAVAGVGMDEMGLIWGKAAARQRLDGELVNQMLERQIPIYDILSKKMGVASEDIAGMVSKGKVDFQTFADAMNDYVGGGAIRMGDTLSGSIANLGAAFGRAGAEILKGPFSQAPAVIGEITDQVDGMGSVIGPIAQEWAGRLTPAVAEFATSAIPTATAALGVFSDGLELSLPLLKGLTTAITSVPTPVLAAGLLTLTARHKGWTQSVDDGAVALLNWTRHARTTDGFAGKMGMAFRSASTPLILLGRETRASATELSGMARVSGAAQGALQSFGGVARGVGAGAVSGLKSGLGGVVSMLGGPWGLAIMGATTVLGILASEHMKAKQAEQEHEQAQRDLATTLDATTGKITEQTNELQRKRAEENGWIQTANEMGVAASTVTAAMNGNADAMREIDAAATVATRNAVEASAGWQQHGEAFRNAGINVDLLSAALSGNQDAFNQVQRAIDAAPAERLRSKFYGISDDVDATSEKFKELRDGVNGAAEDLDKVQAEKLRNAMLEVAQVTENTRAAFSQLGDTITSVQDNKTITVSSMAPEVREQFRELGAEVEQGADGQVRVTFPDGMNVMAMLDEIGAAARMMPDGRVNLSDNTEEVKQRLTDLGLAAKDPVTGDVILNDNLSEVLGKQLELKAAVQDPTTGQVYVNDNISFVKTALNELGIQTTSLPPGSVRIMDNTPVVRNALTQLGIQTTTLPSGHVAITDTTPENMARLADLGIKTQSLPSGHVAISDTSDDNMRRLGDLGIKTTTLPNGQVIVTDNANETANHIKTVLAPSAVNTFSDHVVNITRRITDIFSRGDANGGVYDGHQRAVAFADGGTTRALNAAYAGPRKEPTHVAAITPPGTYRVHGESETGGEAYIPLSGSKRDRSTRILNMVAQRFGYNLVDETGAVAFADGGIVPGAAVEKKLAYMNRTPYIFGGWSPAGVDCSGAVSLGVNASLGLDEWDSRYATASAAQWLAAKGFQRGKGQSGDIQIGVVNGGPGGGHTAMRLDNGTYLESGGNTGGGFTIGGKAGPLEGRGFTDFYHLPGATPLGANEGMAYFDKLDRAVGSRTARPGAGSTSAAGGTQRELNGGTGTLLKDGSVLELVAALYSAKTGQPMDDDVVSWGQAIGLYSELSDKQSSKNQKEASKLSKSIADTTDKLDKKNRELPLAKEDLRIAKMKLDEVKANPKATDSQKAAAEQRVAKAEERVVKLENEINSLEIELKMQQLKLEDSLDPSLMAPVSNTNVTSTSGNRNADAIIREGRKRGITDRGIQIALATALVESDLTMYANPQDPASMQLPHDKVGYDYDSVGLFQQRNNGAWGTTADRMDPAKSAGMFYDELVKADYNTGDPGAHAQRVQRSAYPGRYATRMGDAKGLLDSYNTSGGLKVTAMADGGILGNARQASINEGSAVLWAEAGPEAYIPLSSNKRAGALEIWAETGKRLGVDVMSMLNLMGAALPGLIEGKLDFSTGSSTSLSAMGVNMDAATYRVTRGAHAATTNAVGAVFNGPVQINDPRNYLQGQLDNAARELNKAIGSVMLK